MSSLGRGVLGLNARGIFISEHNTRAHRAFADSKLATKRFFLSHKVAVPALYAYFKKIEDMPDLTEISIPFVIKPNKGFGGGGILVIDDVDDIGNYYDNTGKAYTHEELKRHCMDILAGYFSVSGGRDQVIIEQKIILDSDIALLGEYGLPDIRVIVYNRIPLIAMLRIPSKYSSGKANLHQGAYAAGIDLGTGEISHLFAHNRHHESLEGFGDIRGVVIPHWEEVLELASKAQTLTRMPFIGCDIVLDDEHGPMLLEINARPGLQVQVVNKVRLGERLSKVADIHVDTVEKGVRLARDMFTRKASQNDAAYKKAIIGLREYVRAGVGEESMTTVLAHVDPAKTRGSISSGFFDQLLEGNEEAEGKVTHKSGTPCIKLVLEVEGELIHGLFEVIQGQEAAVILGYGLVKRFILDPEKYGEGLIPPHPEGEKGINAGIVLNRQNQTRDIDAKLVILDRKLPILKHFQPTKVDELRAQFIAKKGRSPFVLEYETHLPDLDGIESELEKVVIPDVPLAPLYADKKEEIQNKIDILRAFSNAQDLKVARISEKLYGGLDPLLLEESELMISRDQGVADDTTDLLGSEEVREVLEKYFRMYDIGLKIEFRSDLLSRVSVGKHTIKVREDIMVSKSDLRAIIAHEVETHYFRRYNGSLHDLEILEKGTAGYLLTEEGLAIQHQNRYLSESSSKNTSLYKLYHALDYAVNHTYRELIEYLENIYEGDLEKMFNVLLRLKRGLREIDSDHVFYKDSVYLNGYDLVRSYIEHGGDIQPLYIGKISKDDVDLLISQGYAWTDAMKLPLFVK